MTFLVQFSRGAVRATLAVIRRAVKPDVLVPVVAYCGFLFVGLMLVAQTWRAVGA